jgi:hypothetical protein
MPAIVKVARALTTSTGNSRIGTKGRAEQAFENAIVQHQTFGSFPICFFPA